MSKIKLNKEQYDGAVEELKNYFVNEREESIGDLQSRLMMDFILEKIGPAIYNQAIYDMQRYMNEKIEDMYEYMR